MRYFLLFLSFIYFSGCSIKVYEPKKTQSKKLKDSYRYGGLSDYTKNGLTFKEMKLKYVKKQSFLDDGVRADFVNYDLKNNYLNKFVKINDDLAAYGDKLYVISSKKVYKLPFLIYSATKNGNLVALVFENGKYGVYDLQARKMKYLYDSDEVLSVRYTHADPLFYKDLILYPLLSGGVAVTESKNGQYIRTLNISQNQFNDNVIYLKIVGDQLFMATPSKLMLFNPSFLIDYKADIKHITDYQGCLYLFTVDGDIVKLNKDLKVIKKVKLPYASFFAPSVCKGNIWTVEKGGYLLKISPDLNVTVYTGNGFDTNNALKIKGCKIYNDNKVFMIE
jgi:hypothetical protein